MTVTHASLFSGIGGAELAATWMGWRNLFHCEVDPFCRRVLEYHYPESTSYGDIRETDFTPWHGKIDVLTGGFPCQPYSLAGKREGNRDDRALWPQMLRAIREIKPSWVVGENVAGILSMVESGREVAVGREASLFGEDNSERIAERSRFTADAICESLEREGYFVQPFVIPACAAGAPHRRDRVWFVAHSDSKLQQSRDNEKQERWDISGVGVESSYRKDDWSNFPTQSFVCDRNDGISIGLVDISFPKWREQSVKALGNSWVPQVAYEVFRAIQIEMNKNEGNENEQRNPHRL